MPSDPTEAAEQQEQLHETARAIVLRQLTASAKSRQQLEDKLADKDIPESVARAVLDRFEQVELVDDQAFAQSYVRQRAETRKLARPALRMELQRKGVGSDVTVDAAGAAEATATANVARLQAVLDQKQLKAPFG
ncbi:MAG: recombination regulator RecX, partial [Micrococcales bacterium]|nr:recombination regulator RecX [Micrococcales bacterium]